jgi:hypothetical protein
MPVILAVNKTEIASELAMIMIISLVGWQIIPNFPEVPA